MIIKYKLSHRTELCKDVSKWLDQQSTFDDWWYGGVLYDSDLGLYCQVFMFDNHDDALLFKLTFGENIIP